MRQPCGVASDQTAAVLITHAFVRLRNIPRPSLGRHLAAGGQQQRFGALDHALVGRKRHNGGQLRRAPGRAYGRDLAHPPFCHAQSRCLVRPRRPDRERVEPAARQRRPGQLVAQRPAGEPERCGGRVNGAAAPRTCHHLDRTWRTWLRQWGELRVSQRIKPEIDGSERIGHHA